MLQQHLIERALALTGRTIDDVEVTLYNPVDAFDVEFSIEKFCYYLLSPEFIEKYKKEYEFALMDDGFDFQYYVKEFGEAIYEYQKGNEEPLISLLSKI